MSCVHVIPVINVTINLKETINQIQSVLSNLVEHRK